MRLKEKEKEDEDLLSNRIHRAAFTAQVLLEPVNEVLSMGTVPEEATRCQPRCKAAPSSRAAHLQAHAVSW